MAENISSKIINKKDEEDYAFGKKSVGYKKVFRFYLIPIISILIFMFIFAFTIVPNVRYMLDGLDKAEELQLESEKLETRIAKLEQLKAQEQEDRLILQKINEIIPSEQSAVVHFREKVAELGRGRGLSVESLKAGEIILDDQDEDEENSNTPLNIIEIPSEFSFTGNFDGFRQLLKSLYGGDDFFVVSKMDLDIGSGVAASSNWRGEFNLIKYQFSNEALTADYKSIPETQEVNIEVVNFIKTNFIEGDLN